MTTSTLPQPAAITTHRRGRVLRLYQLVTVLFLSGIIVQVFFAGAVIFAGKEWREMHISWGYTLPLFPLVLLILAFAGRLPRSLKGIGALLLVMTLLQPNLIYLRTAYPLITALHPVNALGIFTLSLYLLAGVRRL